jgi:hypothetical protein
LAVFVFACGVKREACSCILYLLEAYSLELAAVFVFARSAELIAVSVFAFAFQLYLYLLAA